MDMDEPGRHYAKQNKPETEREVLQDLTYVWNLMKSNSYKQRVEQWLPGQAEGGIRSEWVRVSVLQDEEFWRWTVVMATQQCECT